MKREKRKIAVRSALPALVLLLAAVPLATPLSFGDDLTDAKDKYSDTTKQINTKEDQLEEGKKKAAELQTSISEYEVKINKAQANINVITGSLDTTKEQVNTVLGELDDLEKKLDTQNTALKERLRTMYKEGDIGMISVLLGSSNMAELITNAELVRRIFDSDSQLINQISEQYDEVNTKKEELVDLQTTLQDQTDELVTAKSALDADKKSLSTLKQQVDKNNATLEAQIDALNKIADDLKAEIIKLQSSGKYAGGTMCWPAASSSYITSPFGYRIHPILGYYKFHTGIDIGARYGTKILAANSGTVITAAYNDGYGNYVMVDHGGGIVTLYAHSSQLLVKKGDKVLRGQAIALVGSTGMSTGAHLHFEVRYNGNYQEPTNYVTPGRYYYD